VFIYYQPDELMHANQVEAASGCLWLTHFQETDIFYLPWVNLGKQVLVWVRSISGLNLC
jgi:hypothetical protein